jgi:hypothetical protein
MKLLISVVINPHYNIVDNLWVDYIPVSLKEYMLERYEKILYKHIHLSCNIYINIFFFVWQELSPPLHLLIFHLFVISEIYPDRPVRVIILYCNFQLGNDYQT